MTEDEKMWGRFYNKEEEEARIWAGIRKEEREEGRQEGRQEERNEIVINMYKQKLDIDLISSCVNIKKEEARKIIQDYLSLNKKD